MSSMWEEVHDLETLPEPRPVSRLWEAAQVQWMPGGLQLSGKIFLDKSVDLWCVICLNASFYRKVSRKSQISGLHVDLRCFKPHALRCHIVSRISSIRVGRIFENLKYGIWKIWNMEKIEIWKYGSIIFPTWLSNMTTILTKNHSWATRLALEHMP